MSTGDTSAWDDRNDLARQVADLRDENATLRQERDDAREFASKWDLWVDQASVALTDAKVTDYPRMVDEADQLIDKVKDTAYDRGYRAALSDVRDPIDVLLRDFATKQFGDAL